MQARMRQMSLFAVVAVGLAVILGGTALAQSSNSEVGTWKLNVAKSKGGTSKSGTLTIAAAGAGIKVTVDSVGADGTVGHWEFTANYDGKDNRVVGNNPNSDTAARTRINATTTRTVNKKGGKTTTTLTDVVSSDGKTLTVTSIGTNALGQTVNSVQVYDKQ
jgi:hypothetical protein